MEVNRVNLHENEELSSPGSRSQLLEAIKSASILSVSAVAFVTVLAVWFANTFEEKSQNAEINNDVAEVEAIAPTSANSNLETATPGTLVSPEAEAAPEVVIGKKIARGQQLDELGQKLVSAIDGTWQIPVSATSAYLVRVDETGAIAGYKPLSQEATENAANTPLPQLLTANNPVAGDNPQADFAEFEVVFFDTGALEVKPK